MSTHGSSTGGSVGARYQSLRDMVCEELRDRIIEGELAPGERLVERELGEKLDVSRIVVREAIQQLVAEGLVVVLPRRGAQVAGLDVQGARELFELRITLESFAASAAAERRTDADLERLDVLLAQAREATASGDGKAAAHLNLEFHQAIVEAAGNRLLASVARSLSGQSLRMFRIGQEGDADLLDEEHVELAAAIRARDRRRAAKLMSDHIAATRKATLDRVEQATRD